MRNVMAVALLATVGCAKTPCEEAADLELSCDPALTEGDASEIDLPECEEGSIDACVAECDLANEEIFCEIRAGTAEAAVIQAYVDCLGACADPAAEGT